MQTDYEMPLEELCARVMGMARDFVRGFPSSEIAADALERNSLRRTLEGLVVDGGLSRRDDTDVEIVRSILARELDRETLGWTPSFEGTVDPEHGAVGYETESRDLTERGRMLERQMKQLERFARLRSLCRTRLDAVRLIMGR